MIKANVTLIKLIIRFGTVFSKLELLALFMFGKFEASTSNGNKLMQINHFNHVFVCNIIVWQQFLSYTVLDTCSVCKTIL